MTEGCPFRRRGSSFQACCLATCNVSVRATPPSASAGSQTVAQRLRQQAGRSRQAARQTAPACSSRPFALVGTLTVRFPWQTCREGGRREDVTMQKMQIFMLGKIEQSRTKRRRSSRYVLRVLGLPTSRGRWCSPPSFGCSVRRSRNMYRILKLCLRTSRIKRFYVTKTISQIRVISDSVHSRSCSASSAQQAIESIPMCTDNRPP